MRLIHCQVASYRLGKSDNKVKEKWQDVHGKQWRKESKAQTSGHADTDILSLENPPDDYVLQKVPGDTLGLSTKH